MTIEFHCPTCQRPLRVPNEVAGRNGKCPQCATIFVIPSASTVAAGPTQANPFSDDDAVNPYDVGGIPARHFLEPGRQQQFSSTQPVAPQPADLSVILGLSFSLWQRHLGLLVGTTVITLVVAVFFAISYFTAVAYLVEVPEFAQGLRYHLAQDALQLTGLAVQSYFWIGQVQICCKLARNQPAEFADLFGGGDRFIPLVGAWLLVLVPVYVIDYGILFVLSWGNLFGEVDAGLALAYSIVYYLLASAFTLLFWPVSYLVADRKASILDSYFLALHVTDGNRWTTFLLVIFTILILLVGYLGCLVGLLFATPLVFLVWSVAYLMMAGQIPSYNWMHQPSVYR